MFKINNLSAGYGGITAISEINLEIKRGEIITIVGANGAGKSTLLKTISGILKASSGSIHFNGEVISNKSPHLVVAKGIAHSPEGRKVFSTLSVKENLIMGAYRCKTINLDTLDFIYTTFPRLKERHSQLAGTLSGGEQQMLAIGRALMGEPELLLLDEPSLGLSPAITKEVFALISKINVERKLAILLVEQNASAALKLSNRGYVMEVGRIVLEGEATDLLDSPLIRQAYLGKSH